MSSSNRGAAVVDVILSSHARGYSNSMFVANSLFPRAPVSNRAMRTIRFGKESFRVLNTRRAPGANMEEVQYGYASDAVALVQDALAGKVPVEHQEEALSVPGIDLGAGAVNMVLDVLDLGHELECSKLARDPAAYGDDNKVALAGSDKWNHADSDPHADVTEAKEAIRRRTGRYPNRLALGPNVFNALKRHADVKAQFKYTSSKSITAEMLAAYFDIEEVVVGKAVYLPENAADDVLANDVWGNDAILAFVPTAETGNFQVPSFGYCYELAGYPQVETPFYKNENKSWIYPTTVERAPKLTGPDAGFLFAAAVDDPIAA